MPTLETVRGPVDTADLGPTPVHEHDLVLSTEHVRDHGVGTWWDEDERVADVLTELGSPGSDTDPGAPLRVRAHDRW
ncbi:hypothetical protein ACI79G_01940 [Geodermatophilus sp. SYSU D00779]